MAVFSNSFEGQTDGVAVTAANSGASGTAYSAVTGAVAAYSNAHPAHGTMGVKFAPVAATAYHLDFTSFASTSLSDCFYLYFETVPTANDAIAQYRTAVGQAGNITVLSTGKLQIQQSAGTGVATATNALSANTLYRVECQIFSDATVGTMALQYYLGDSTSAIESVSGSGLNTRGGNITQRLRGSTNTATVTANVYYIDGDRSQDGTLTPLGPEGADSGPNYAGAAADLGGAQGAWVNPANADGAPDSTFATWAVP